MEAKNLRELRKEVKKWGWKSYSIKKLNKTNKNPAPRVKGKGDTIWKERIKASTE